MNARSERRTAPPTNLIHVERRLSGVLVVDADGIVRYDNLAARHLIGTDERTLVGRPFGLPIGEDVAQVIEIVDREGVVQSVDMRVARYVGSDFAGAEVWAVTLRPSATAAADPRAVDDQLARLDDALSVTYHELGNAVAGISAGLTVLREAWPDLEDADRLHRVARIERAATGMALHLKSYLDASRIDSGVFKPRPSPHRLLDLVLEHLPDLGAHAADIEVQVSPNVTVDMDATHCWSVVGNFIRNALKHGAHPITLRAATVGPETLIVVTDHGQGVPAAHVGRLFERFGMTGPADPVTSSGLGLWIASTMASAYGGRVWYERNAPTGSRFCARLPAASPEARDFLD